MLVVNNDPAIHRMVAALLAITGKYSPLRANELRDVTDILNNNLVEICLIVIADEVGYSDVTDCVAMVFGIREDWGYAGDMVSLSDNPAIGAEMVKMGANKNVHPFELIPELKALLKI